MRSKCVDAHIINIWTVSVIYAQHKSITLELQLDTNSNAREYHEYV